MKAGGDRAAVKRVVRWAVTLGILVLLVVFARRVEWGATWRAARGASVPLLLGATAVNILSLAFKGIRWWIFLRPLGARTPWLSVRATAAGAGLNNVLVANGGDAARVVFVTRSMGLPSATVLATLALERVFDVVGYVMLLVAGALVVPLPPALERHRAAAEWLLAAMVLGLGLLVFRRAPVAEAAATVAHVTVPDSLVGRARRYLRRFGRSVTELSTGPRFVGALVLSMLAWACQLACFALAARATGVGLSLGGSLAALLAVNAGLLIRATPGNVGVFQLAYALAAGYFGVANEPAVAVALLIQTLQIIPTTLLGVALAPEFVLRRRRSGQEG